MCGIGLPCGDPNCEFTPKKKKGSTAKAKRIWCDKILYLHTNDKYCKYRGVEDSCAIPNDPCPFEKEENMDIKEPIFKTTLEKMREEEDKKSNARQERRMNMLMKDPRIETTEGEFTIKTSEENRDYSTGASRDHNKDKGRFDLLPPFALHRVAKHYQKGADIRGRNNWRKGMPIADLLDSARRHLNDYFACRLTNTKQQEDHLAAAVWNILGAMETEELIKREILPSELDNVLGDLEDDFKS